MRCEYCGALEGEYHTNGCPNVPYSQTQHDTVTKPEHYCKDRRIEPLDVIEDWDLPHHLACVIKYISRYGRSPEGFEGIKKAAEYIRRFLAMHGEL